MSKNWLYAGLALLAGIAVSFYSSTGIDKQEHSPASSIQLEQIELPDLGGTPQSLKQWQGKLLLVNFWASWCPPCLDEIPIFLSLRKNYLDDGFEVVGISTDSVQDVMALRDSLNIDYPLLDGEKKGIALMASLGNKPGALPYSVLFDRHGKAVHFKTGKFRHQELQKLLEKYL
jgi:thiol-disulfide isomerase/thioredoxin